MSENKPRRRAQAARAVQKSASRKSGLSRVMLVAMMMVLVAVVSIGGTMAWLQAVTPPVENTFTVGNIDIELYEYATADAQPTDKIYKREGLKITPGNDIFKDPTVEVKTGSENCWLFVKVVEENWPTATEEGSTTRKVDYQLAPPWTALGAAYPGVYYYDATEIPQGTEIQVLVNDQVTVSDNLTKKEIDDHIAANTVDGTFKAPKLTFTAYAIQRDTNIATEDDAWTKISGN